MIWFWSFVFVLIMMSASFWSGYKRTKDMVGQEAAQRHLRSVLPWLLVGFAASFLILLLWKYGFVSRIILFPVVILFSVGVHLWLLSWFFRKKESGNLLLNIGRNPQSKYLFRTGKFLAALAVFWSLGILARSFYGLPQDILEVTGIIFLWDNVVYYIALGLSKLEFRENGICFMCSFISWKRVKSCDWEKSKPNTLTIQLKPRHSLSSGFMSMTIPEQHLYAVSHILDEKLPAKNL